jgi:hypothetical protein
MSHQNHWNQVGQIIEGTNLFTQNIKEGTFEVVMLIGDYTIKVVSYKPAVDEYKIYDLFTGQRNINAEWSDIEEYLNQLIMLPMPTLTGAPLFYERRGNYVRVEVRGEGVYYACDQYVLASGDFGFKIIAAGSVITVNKKTFEYDLKTLIAA